MSKKQKIKKAVIPAAGFGTRLLPATKAQPKEMLPVFDKPVIQYVVEEGYESGIRDFLIITGRHKRAIEDHFDSFPELEEKIRGSKKEEKLKDLNEILKDISIHYIRQKNMKGLGDAISYAKSFVGDEPFLVLLGDTITEPNCSKEIVNNFRGYESRIAVREVEKKEVEKYGVVDVDENMKIKNMIEKPKPEKAPSNLAIVGRYILQPEIFEYIKNTKPGKGGEIQLTDAMNMMVKDGYEYYADVYKGRVYDIGNKLSWLESTIEIAFHSKYKEEVKKIMKRLLSNEKDFYLS